MSVPQALRQRLAAGAGGAAAPAAAGAAPGAADWGVVGEHLVDPNYLDAGAPARRASEPTARAQPPAPLPGARKVCPGAWRRAPDWTGSKSVAMCQSEPSTSVLRILCSEAIAQQNDPVASVLI